MIILRLALNEKIMKKQVEKVVRKKVMLQIDKAINGSGSQGNSSAKQLLQGLFGQ